MQKNNTLLSEKLKICFIILRSLTQLTTDDLRSYLANYQSEKDCSRANWTIFGVYCPLFLLGLSKRNISSRILFEGLKKIKTEQTVKETYTDEHLEIMRDNCEI